MKTKLKERKIEEKEFHDKLRTLKKKDDSNYEFYTHNKRFYSVARRSRFFVNEWLRQRCKDKKVLDYCCGNGGTSIFLAKNGAKTIGIDISEKSIENAKKNTICEGVNENTSFFTMDAEKLEFENNFFDIIICNGVLHHLDIKRAYPELARVLKPEGEIICDEPLKYNPIIQLYRRKTPHLRTKWETEHILRKKDLDLAMHYFGKLEIRFFHLATLAAVPFRKFLCFNFILSALEAVDSILLKTPLLKWMAWQAVFVLSQPKKSPRSSAYKHL